MKPKFALMALAAAGLLGAAGYGLYAVGMQRGMGMGMGMGINGVPATATVAPISRRPTSARTGVSR